MSIEAKQTPHGDNSSTQFFDSTLSGQPCWFSWISRHRARISGNAPWVIAGVFSLLLFIQGCATYVGDFARSGGDFARAKDRVAELLSRAIQIEELC